jgi:hypothetical protein
MSDAKFMKFAHKAMSQMPGEEEEDSEVSVVEDEDSEVIVVEDEDEEVSVMKNEEEESEEEKPAFNPTKLRAAAKSIKPKAFSAHTGEWCSEVT